MSARKIRQGWFAEFRFGGERCRKKSPLNTEEGALAYEMFLRKEASLWGSVGAALRANAPANRAPCPTLAEFMPRWFAGYVAANNRPMERNAKRFIADGYLVPELGNLRLCDIGPEEVERYKGRRRAEGLAAKTVNNHLAVLHKCLVCAKEWKAMRTEVPRMPVLRAPEPAFRFLSPEECGRLLAAARGQLRTMVLAGLRTGLRFCELSALRWEDVDLARGFLTVSRSAVGGHVSPPKNGRVRHVPLTGELVDALSELPRACGLVFHRRGDLLGYRAAQTALARASAEAGVGRIGWHALRHTFASRLVSLGASLLAVQKLLGHSSIQVTMRYSHLGKDGLRDAIGLLEEPSHRPVAAP